MRRIAHVSDLHFGRHDSGAEAALLGALEGLAPDLVVVSGDLTQRARRAQFAAAREFLGQIKAPLLVVPGNHDIAPVWYPVRRLIRPFARFERYISSDRAPLYADEEIAVLGINTARRTTAKDGRISVGQMTAMAQAFSALPPTTFRIVVTHHPLSAPEAFASDRAERAGRSAAAMEVLAAAGVRLLLSGHHHRAGSGLAAAEIGAAAPAPAILVAHAGTAISTRTRDEANSFNLIEVDRASVTIAVLVLSRSGRFAEAARTGFGYDGHIWRPAAAAA
jgi:3',5'-cyclic AMP phosphodiesterase CpdA